MNKRRGCTNLFTLLHLCIKFNEKDIKFIIIFITRFAKGFSQHVFYAHQNHYLKTS